MVKVEKKNSLSKFLQNVIFFFFTSIHKIIFKIKTPKLRFLSFPYSTYFCQCSKFYTNVLTFYELQKTI